jgi:hypothetical protein
MQTTVGLEKLTSVLNDLGFKGADALNRSAGKPTKKKNPGSARGADESPGTADG